jgi:phage terminase large subunit-like protein
MPTNDLSKYKQLLTELTSEQFEDFLASMTDVELIDFQYDLEWQGRPKQQLPEGEWSNWLILSGRGFGKSWLGSKVINNWAKNSKVSDIALIGDNIGEVRDVMIEGPSGILKLARPDFYPHWNKTLGQLTYPNGCKVKAYSGQEPESLRGPNNGKAWIDELFKFRAQQEVWDELMMTMRSGDNPQTIITSTPRPTALCKRLVADQIKYSSVTKKRTGSTQVTRGSTYENYELNKRFLEETIQKYEGTRRGRQELYGELLEDNPGALWKLEDIEGTKDAPIRVKTTFQNEKDEPIRWLDTMDRIVVAIDPATTSNEETSDETGIVVAGRKADQGYIFYAKGGIETPNEWAQRAVTQFNLNDADRVIGEANNGGDMIEAIIRNVAPNISYKKVHASRGKAIRAEPISALYEQHRIHHVGQFPELEDEMLSFDPALGRDQRSPNIMDALVWALTDLFGDRIRTPRIIALYD